MDTRRSCWGAGGVLFVVLLVSYRGAAINPQDWSNHHEGYHSDSQM